MCFYARGTSRVNNGSSWERPQQAGGTGKQERMWLSVSIALVKLFLRPPLLLFHQTAFAAAHQGGTGGFCAVQNPY